MRRLATTASKQNFDAVGLRQVIIEITFTAQYQRSATGDSKFDAARSYRSVDLPDEIDVG